MSTVPYTIVAWRAYGDWYSTRPFTTRAEAEKHAKRHLESDEIRHPETGAVLSKNSREHYKDITFLTVELPE